MAQSAQINGWTSEESLFDFQEKHESILHFKASRPALHHCGPPSPLSNGYLGAPSPGIKRLGHEAVHPPHTAPKLRKNGTTYALRRKRLWREQ